MNGTRLKAGNNLSFHSRTTIMKYALKLLYGNQQSNVKLQTKTVEADKLF